MSALGGSANAPSTSTPRTALLPTHSSSAVVPASSLTPGAAPPAASPAARSGSYTLLTQPYFLSFAASSGST